MLSDLMAYAMPVEKHFNYLRSSTVFNAAFYSVSAVTPTSHSGPLMTGRLISIGNACCMLHQIQLFSFALFDWESQEWPTGLFNMPKSSVKRGIH